MAVTARMPLQLEPAEKRNVARKAKALGMSVNDYVRTALRSFRPELVSEREIDHILRELTASTARAERALDRALADARRAPTVRRAMRHAAADGMRQPGQDAWTVILTLDPSHRSIEFALPAAILGFGAKTTRLLRGEPHGFQHDGVPPC